MKKVTAMLLMLSLMLAVVPALGESAAGDWYMTLMDVTINSYRLNEDGTLVVQIGPDEQRTGTWEQSENTVTVNMENYSLSFVYDGASLVSSELPLPLTRDAGRMSLDLISKALNGEEYELPEGVVPADLALTIMKFLPEYTKLANADAGGDLAGTEPVSEPQLKSGDPVVTFVSSSFIVTESYSGYRGTYIAKIRNDYDTPIFITGGSMTVSDADGNQVAEENYLYTTGSRYLEPGETSFVSMYTNLEQDGEYSCKASVESNTRSYRSPDTPLRVADPVYVPAESEYDSPEMRVTVFNDSDTPIAGIEAVMVLMNSNGRPITISTEGLYRHELGAGSSITLVSTVDSRIRKFCEDNGVEIASVEAYAWVEND